MKSGQYVTEWSVCSSEIVTYIELQQLSQSRNKAIH